MILAASLAEIMQCLALLTFPAYHLTFGLKT